MDEAIAGPQAVEADAGPRGQVVVSGRGLLRDVAVELGVLVLDAEPIRGHDGISTSTAGGADALPREGLGWGGEMEKHQNAPSVARRPPRRTCCYTAGPWTPWHGMSGEVRRGQGRLQAKGA